MRTKSVQERVVRFQDETLDINAHSAAAVFRQLASDARVSQHTLDMEWLDESDKGSDKSVKVVEKEPEDEDIYLHLTEAFVSSCIPRHGITISDLEHVFGAQVKAKSKRRKVWMRILGKVAQPEQSGATAGLWFLKEADAEQSIQAEGSKIKEEVLNTEASLVKAAPIESEYNDTSLARSYVSGREVSMK